MKANEILTQMKDETVSGIFHYLRDNQRPVYAATLAGLAKNRRLRPVFLQRKPFPQQLEWLVRNVRLKSSSEVAENVLQLWLLKVHSPLLVAFLDGLGISHDGEGAADDIPDEFDTSQLKETVAQLLKDFDPELVMAYLHTFQLQRPGGWPEIKKLIEDTPEFPIQRGTLAVSGVNEE